MRNGRAVRLGEPVKCHALHKRGALIGIQSADHIMASAHSGCNSRAEYMTAPDHSRKRQIPLAPRAPFSAAVVRNYRVGAALVLAACNMPAERRRATGLDRAHHFQLRVAHVTAVGITPSR